MTSKQNLQHQTNFRNCVLASGAFVVLALSLVAQGCSSSSGSSGTGGSTSAGTGGSTSSGSGGSTTSGSGGSTTSGSGGSTTSGTGGSISSGSGGSTTSGSGGATTTSTGGAAVGSGGATSSTGGASGNGGTTTASTGGAGGGGATAAACTTQTKAMACISPTDVCAKSCGPKAANNTAIANKLLTCTNGVYVEAACNFPAADYTCFKVSATTAACPAATASGGACTIASCMPCSGYNDATGAAKVGYCHCVNMKWSCGSTKEWPCTATGTSTSPGGTGC